jgi:hypothetical protein
VFKVYTPDLREVVFIGAIDPHTPVAQGWLRASHRKLDAKLTHPTGLIILTMNFSHSNQAFP